MSGTISYSRTFFSWQDYTDFVDPVQAGGTNGINLRMHNIEKEFDQLGGVVGQVNAGLFFKAIGAAGAVAYTGGSVGIGNTFSTASPPVYQLDVNLGDNSGVNNQVRFGNAVCCNGNTGLNSTYAVFAHKSHASDTDFAVRQGPNGNVDINVSTGQPLTFRQAGANIRFGMSPAGNVIIGADIDQPGAGAAILQVVGDAFKLVGSSAWLVPSDARLKEDVRDLEVGLAHLRQVRPVRFRYNGKGGTQAGQAGIGVLGQEIEQIFPETVRRMPGEADTEDLRIYDSSPLTYVLINAVKELAGKVEELERELTALRNRN
jgi:hypothetical protein